MGASHENVFRVCRPSMRRLLLRRRVGVRAVRWRCSDRFRLIASLVRVSAYYGQHLSQVHSSIRRALRDRKSLLGPDTLHGERCTFCQVSIAPHALNEEKMEALPYELLEDIFILAFTDGGRTACSVSLVSRRMRHLSSRYRFHSVALRSRTLQIASFLATFALQRARYRDAGPLLRHLYIASPATSSYHWFSRYVHDPDGWPHFGTAFVGHALALLALVASELTTLVLVQCPSELLDPIGRTGFPNLQELTVVGGRELIFATHGEAIAVHAPEPLYPHVVRLNLISPVVLFSHWTMHAPHVTDLRLSGSARQDYIDEDIRDVLLRNLRAGGELFASY